ERQDVVCSIIPVFPPIMLLICLRFQTIGKKAYFLSFCGAAVFDTATALLVPQTVKAISWEDLQELLSNHYLPKPLQGGTHSGDEYRLKERPSVPTWPPSEKQRCIAGSGS
ncbi:hypothetical protein E2320_003765, partial [Naja naja]